MHPIIEPEIMKTRTVQAHRRADQARLARAARQGRRTGPPGTVAAAPAAAAAWSSVLVGRAPAGDLRLSGTKGGPGRIPGRACRQRTARPAGGLAVHDRLRRARGLGWTVTGRCRFQSGRAAAPGRTGRRRRRSRAGIVSGPAPVGGMPSLRPQAVRRVRTFRPAISAVTAMVRTRAGHPLRGGRAVAGLVPADTSRPARMMKPFRAVRVSRDAAGACDRARRHGPCVQGAGGRWAEGDSDR
jgi:hypothetical protein